MEGALHYINITMTQAYTSDGADQAGARGIMAGYFQTAVHS